MINELTVSILPYDTSVLNEEDIEDLTKLIVHVAQLGFESIIISGNIPRKDAA